MSTLTLILGASDPEMQAIEALGRQVGAKIRISEIEMEKKLEGTAGLMMFNDFYARAVSCKQVMSKRQKLQLAALKRKADKHDLLDDWKPLIDSIFEIWGV